MHRELLGALGVSMICRRFGRILLHCGHGASVCAGVGNIIRGRYLTGFYALNETRELLGKVARRFQEKPAH